MQLHKLYNPITATPFEQNDEYVEYEPCKELKPYIRCFWGSERPYRKIITDIPTQGIVTPDTCVDIIFRIDFTNNKIHGSFCGINDKSFSTHHNNDENNIASIFAVRFYAWSAIYFVEDSLHDTKNGFFDVGCHFSNLKKEIESLLFDVVNIEERINIVQKYLLEHIHLERRNEVVTEAIADILLNKGNIEVANLSKDLHVSTRHLERLFKQNMGISPKQLSSLIRYQFLWSDILYHRKFHALDAVFKYGYTDQAHLLRDFKKYHTMTIPEARKYALQHVALLQEGIS